MLNRFLKIIMNKFKKKIFFIKYLIFKLFNIKTINSAYNLIFYRNYKDTTFKFYVIGKYGYKYWNRIMNIEYPFLFMDIGSNQGLYAIGSLKNKNCIESYAFEPIPKTYELLLKNIDLNKTKNCKAFNIGISSFNGYSDMYYDPKHSGAASLNEMKNSNNTKVEIINYQKLSKLIISKYPIHIKIDVEGHELAVITEIFKSKFSNNIKELYFEVDERWSEYDKIKSILNKNGFYNLKKSSNNSIHYDVLASK